MPKHLIILRCSRTTAIVTITASICLFILIGCASLFRSAGLTDEQAQQQTAELKSALEGAASDAIANVQSGLEAGHDLKTIAVKTGSTFLWKIITAASASVGVVLNGLLAKWLSTEKKITKVMITGIEDTNSNDIKKTIKANALSAGVQSQLDARVQALT